MDELRIILNKFKPQIWSISEANYDIKGGQNLTDYKIEYSDMGIGYNLARQVLIVHNSINYIRRKDLEQKYISSVIIDVKLANQKIVTVMGLYRQWNLPKGICDNENNSQVFRYSKLLETFSNI